MVLKLYGVYRSPWVRLVAAVLLEKQVAFELVSVDITNGEQKLPEYLSKNPYVKFLILYVILLIFLAGEIAINLIYLIPDLIRTMTASSSLKVEPYATI
jgi:Glutathione S-transferase, N-terminal domain